MRGGCVLVVVSERKALHGVDMFFFLNKCFLAGEAQNDKGVAK